MTTKAKRRAQALELSDEGFHEFWSNLRNDTDHKSQLLALRQVVTTHKLQVRQVVKLLSCFTSSDKIDVFCLVVYSIQDLHLDYAVEALCSCFSANQRIYVENVLHHIQSAKLDYNPTNKQKYQQFLPVSVVFQTRKQIVNIVASISRSAFSSNQDAIISALASDMQTGIRFQEIVYFIQALLKWQSENINEFSSQDEITTSLVIQALSKFSRYILGLTCADLESLTKLNEYSEKWYPIIELLVPRIKDRENIATLQSLLSDSKLFTQEQVKLLFHNLPLLPHCPLFGQVTSQDVLFMIDCSSGSEYILNKPNGERVQVLRLIVDHLSRVLKEHLSTTQRFNIQAFSDTSLFWMKQSVSATPANVDNACLFLRSLVPNGYRNLHRATLDAMKTKASTLHLVVHGSIVSELNQFSIHQINATDSALTVSLDTKHRNLQAPWQYLRDVSTEARTPSSYYSEQVRQSSEQDEALNPSTVQQSKHSRSSVLNTSELQEWYKISRCSSNFVATGLIVDASDREHEVRKMMSLLRSFIEVAPTGSRFMNILDTTNQLHQISVSNREGQTSFTIDSTEARSWQGVNVVAFLCLVLGVAMQRAGLVFPRSCSQVAFRYPTYVLGSSSLFVLWPISFVCLGAIVAYVCHRTRIHPSSKSVPFPLVGDGIIRTVGFIAPCYTVTTIGWHFAFATESFLEANVFGVLQLLTLIYAKQKVGFEVPSDSYTWTEQWFFIQLPLSVMLSWSSYVLVLSIATTLVSANWYWFGMDSEWAIITLSGLGFLSCLQVSLERDPGYGLTTVAILFGISLPHLDDVYLLTASPDQNHSNGSLYIVLVCCLFTVLNATLSLSAIITRSLYFYVMEKSGSEASTALVMARLSQVPIVQAINIVAFGCEVILHTSTQQIIPVSCSSVVTRIAQDNSPVYLMLAPFAFWITPALMVWSTLSIMVPSLLPVNELLRDPDELGNHDEIVFDVDMKHLVYLATKENGSNRTSRTFWKWRLTNLGHQIIFHVIGANWALLSLSLTGFQIAFRLQNFLVATGCILLALWFVFRMQGNFAAHVSRVESALVAAGLGKLKVAGSWFVTIVFRLPFGFWVGWLTYIFGLMLEITVLTLSSDDRSTALYSIVSGIPSAFRRDQVIVAALVLVAFCMSYRTWSSSMSLSSLGFMWALTALALENLYFVCYQSKSFARLGLHTIPQKISELGVEWFTVSNESDCEVVNQTLNVTRQDGIRKAVAWVGGKCRRVFYSPICAIPGTTNAGLATLDAEFQASVASNWFNDVPTDGEYRVCSLSSVLEPAPGSVPVTLREGSSCYCVEELGICSAESLSVDQYSMQQVSPPFMLGVTAMSLCCILAMNSILRTAVRYAGY